MLNDAILWDPTMTGSTEDRYSNTRAEYSDLDLAAREAQTALQQGFFGNLLDEDDYYPDGAVSNQPHKRQVENIRITKIVGLVTAAAGATIDIPDNCWGFGVTTQTGILDLSSSSGRIVNVTDSLETRMSNVSIGYVSAVPSQENRFVKPFGLRTLYLATSSDSNVTLTLYLGTVDNADIIQWV